MPTNAEKLLTASLAIMLPEVAREWHSAKNGALTPNNVFAKSSKKFWWQCDQGHEWEAMVSNRAKGKGCPYCSGRSVLSGTNDLATLHPDLAKEWHPTMNGSLTPSQAKPFSQKKAWWQCANGHEWEAVIGSRTQGNGCPYCANRKVLAGYNDLAATNSSMATQWHPTKNGELTPSQVTVSSGYKAWWQCANGHEWQTTLNDRTNYALGCPFCSNRRTIPGENDLATLRPDLAAEWSEKNDRSPNEFTLGSEYAAWWRCDNGHEWQIGIQSRAGSKASGCPRCANQTSAAEKSLGAYLESLGLTVEYKNRKLLRGKEIDIYLPEQKVGIEYNGLYWHSDAVRMDRKSHEMKWQLAKAADIQLIQLWEDDWKAKPELVKELLGHKLGVSTAKVAYGRQTTVHVLGKQAAETFLHQHHIQGYASGGIYLGLQDRAGALCAVVVLRKRGEGEFEIVRYATSRRVPGGFTKLISYAERHYPVKRLITFSDHMISDGALYYQTGFVADKELRPDYMYVVRGKREHKFNYRLQRFERDPKLQWAEGKSESQLAQLNGIPRVWDAGKTRWVKEVT